MIWLHMINILNTVKQRRKILHEFLIKQFSQFHLRVASVHLMSDVMLE